MTRRYTEDTEAYQLYLRGRYNWNKGTIEGFEKAIDYFQQAINTDSNYAPAYAGLADCYNMLVVYGVYQPKDGFPKAKDAAVKALRDEEAQVRQSAARGVMRSPQPTREPSSQSP